MIHTEHIVGLDLGQASDYTALCVVERTERFPDGRIPDPEVTRRVGHYAVRHLKRYALGTPYPAIVRDVAALLTRPPLPGSTLVVDGTGVGRAVVDMFRQAELPGKLEPVTITSGNAISRQADGWHVAKRQLAGTLAALLPQQRLKIAEMPERDVLLRELRTFRVKVSTATGNESYESWRESDKDDCVLSVAIAVWFGEHGRRRDCGFRIFGTGRRRQQKGLRIVACSRDALAALPVEESALLVSLTDPTPAGNTIAPPHQCNKLIDAPLCLSFTDQTAEEIAHRWETIVQPHGRPAHELLMSRDQGKKLWAYLRRERGAGLPEVILIADDGGRDRRALSVALAIADMMRCGRQVVLSMEQPDETYGDGDEPANRYVYDITKTARHLVL